MVPSLHRFATLALTLSILRQIEVTAQIVVNAVCTQAEWTFNHRSQSPCFVAANLMGTCTGGQFDFSGFPPPYTGWSYSGPTRDQSNQCWCSTVTYAMNAACGLCQGGEWYSWTYWQLNCTTSDITIASFPLVFPAAISVPAWAYLDPTVNISGGAWSISLAQALIDRPDIPGGSQPTTLTDLISSTSSISSSTTTAPIITTTTSAITTTSPPPTTTTPSPKRPSRTIAVGVGVGIGSAVFAIIGIGLLYCFWKRPKDQAPADTWEKFAPQFPATLPYRPNDDGQQTPSSPSFGQPTPSPGFGQQPPSPSFGQQTHSSSFGQLPPSLGYAQPAPLPPLLYDPSNPATFPTYPMPTQDPSNPTTFVTYSAPTHHGNPAHPQI